MFKPEISILMPARNAAVFIGEALLSVMEQDFRDWELIIVDDFSGDETAACVKQLVQNDARIKFLPNKSQGIIPALQLAFEYANGAYITRMDADDIMPPGKLSALYSLVQGQLKMVVTGCVNYFSRTAVSEGYRRYEKWLNSLVAKNEFYSSVYRECIIASPNWMVHRSCFENDFRFADLNYPEDYDMVFRWYKAGYKIRSINEVTHLWREHENRTSRHAEAYQQQSFFKLKTNYFVDLELKGNEKIQLFGAASKGKLVAEILSARNVDFDWFDFGTSINRKIGNKSVQPVSQVKSNIKSILTAWPVDDKTQQDISAFLKSKELVFGTNVWLF